MTRAFPDPARDSTAATRGPRRAWQRGVRALRCATAGCAFVLASLAASASAETPGASLDADRHTTRTTLSAAALGGQIAGDAVAGLRVGAGFEHAWGGVRLSAPLWFRLQPTPAAAGQPAVCGTMRCEEWLADGDLHAADLSRIIDAAYVGNPDAPFELRVEPMKATLGTGGVVDRVVNTWVWDRRRAGAYARGTLPWWNTQLTALTTDVLQPATLAAVRVQTAPWHDPAVDGALGRLQFAADVAADGFAATSPHAVNRALVLADLAATRPLAAGNITAAWATLPRAWRYQVTPMVGLGWASGLAAAAGAPGVFGAGGSIGLGVDIPLPAVSVRGEVHGTLHTPGHKDAVFGPLYDIERHRGLFALSRGDDANGDDVNEPGTATLDSVATRGAPSGWGVRTALAVRVLDFAEARVGYQRTPARVDDMLDVGLDVAAGPVRAGLAAVCRAPQNGCSAPGLPGMQGLVGTAELAWAFWGPLQAQARWVRAPRATDGAWTVHDDVMLGISASLVLMPLDG